MIDALRPVPGGSFSTLTPSMWPQEILAKLGQPEVCFDINAAFRIQMNLTKLIKNKSIIIV